MTAQPASPRISSPLHLANLNTFNPKTSLHFAETYIFRGQSAKNRPYGELFVVLQIDHSSKTSPQLGDAVATILQHEYYRGNPSDAAKNFEDALHKTNEILSDLAARGEIHWIGKMHGVIAVFQRGTIHVSATGRGKAFLVRDNDIAEISAGLYDATKAASPMKTFEHLASGDLKDGDVVLLSTPGITEVINPQILRELLRANSPEQAAQEMQKRVGRDPALASSAIVLRFDSKNLQTIATGSSSTAKETVPGKSGSKDAKNSPTKLDGAGLATLPAKPKAAKSKKRFNIGIITGLFSRFGKKNRKKTAVTGPSDSKSDKVSTPKKAGRIRAALQMAWKRMSLKAKVFLGLALLAVFIFIVSLFVFTGQRQSKQERQALVDKFAQAKQLEEQAAAAIIFKDFTQGLNLLKQAEGLLGEVANDSALKTDVEALRQTIAQDYEKLSGSVKIDEPKELAKISGSGEAVGLTLVNGQLAVWTAGGEVSLVNVSNGDQAEAATLDRDLGEPVLGATDDKRVVLYTDESILASFDGKKVDELTVSGSFKPKTPIAMESYGNRLYILDPGSNKVTRHQRTLAGYSQGDSWILDETSVAEAVDLAIDGDMWLLGKSGSVTKMTQGTRAEFTLGGVLDPLESPTRLIAGEDMAFIFILEPAKKRLLQFEKESGEFVKQYTSEKFDDLRDFAVIEKGGKAYLLNNSTVLEIDLQS